MTQWLAAFVGGLLLGARHALDADHLAAMAVLAHQHQSWQRAAFVGAVWGVGHSIALAVAGVIVLLTGVQFPPLLTWWLEFTVAATLIGLGIRSLVALLRGDTVHTHIHRHGDYWHVHPHRHRRLHKEHHAKHHLYHHGSTHAGPLLLGMLHGFAGSAAIFLLLLARDPSSALAWVYLLAFAAGSTLAMSAFSAALSLSCHWRGRSGAHWQRNVRVAAGFASIVVGFTLAYELILA